MSKKSNFDAKVLVESRNKQVIESIDKILAGTATQEENLNFLLTMSEDWIKYPFEIKQ
jgi:hypothetical protein